MDIDSNQRVQLAMEGTDGGVLPARVPYYQLKPFLEDNTEKAKNNSVVDGTSHTHMDDEVQAVKNSALVTSPHMGGGQGGIVCNKVDVDVNVVVVDVAEMKPRKQHVTCHSKNAK